ncbi:hypothetical protein ACUY29_12265 [Corynebacterium aurimucosum]
MSKQDRAAKAIKFGAARGYSPEQIATLLNELNLLAADLPAPRIFPNTGEYEWHMTDGYVSLEDGIIHVIHDETDDDWEPAELNPDHCELRFSDTTKARETAYAILAACDRKDTQDA